MLVIARRTVQAVVLILALVMVLLAALSVIASGDPADSETWRLGVKPMTVLGGSMEPAIHVGSLTLVARTDTSKITVGDVVTFAAPIETRSSSLEPGTITTHRVVGIESAADGITFTTKGDANEDPDRWPVSADSIVGSPILTIPYLGYLARWASSRAGFVLLIVIPGLLLIGTELQRLRRPATDSSPSVPAEVSSGP